MPLKKKYTPATPTQEGPSLGRKLGAGAIRVGSGLLSSIPGAIPNPIGTPLAGFIGGVGESLAEKVEGSEQNPARILLEAGISAVPFGKLIKGGQFLKSAIPSGLLTGVGEAGRELTTEGEVDPGSVGMASLLGFLTGGTVGKLTKGKAPAAPTPRDIVEHTAQPGGQVLKLGGKGIQTSPTFPRSIPRETGVSPTPTPGPRFTNREEYMAWKAAQEGRPIPSHEPDLPTSSPADIWEIPYNATVEPQGGAGVPFGAGEPPIYRTAAKAAQKADDAIVEAARKTAENEARAEAIAEARGGMVEQPPRVGETISAETPLGKERLTRSWKPEEEGGDELSEFLSTGAVSSPKGGKRWAGVKQTDIPPEGTPPRDIFEAWLEEGRTPKAALKLAAKGRPPVGSEIEIPGRPGAIVSERLVPETPVPVSTPEVPPSSSAPEVPIPIQTQATEVIPPSQPVIPTNIERSPEDFLDFIRSGGARVEQAGEPTSSELLKFFRPSEVADLVGENYRYLREAQKAPGFLEELKGNLPLDTRGRPITPANMAGIELRRRAGGVPAPAPQVPETLGGVVSAERKVPAVTPTEQLDETAGLIEKLKGLGVKGSQDISESIGLIDQLKQLAAKKGGTTLGAGLGGAQDIAAIIARNPEFAARLGLGAVGGGVGVATDPFDNPLASGAAGFAAGFASPSIVRGLGELGVNPQVMSGIAEKLSSPEGIKEGAQAVARSIPHIQRFNFLADAAGLPPNVFAGPWGSAMMGALEHGLSGDERGWGAAKALLNPKFFKDFFSNLEEAKLILARGEGGRAEQGILEHGPEQLKTLLAAPGTAMTAGDVTARRILMNAGFSEDEARRITLTSEPELPFFKGVAESHKNSPLGQFLFPFRRTPANIGEQGGQRLPGLGLLVQGMRDTPDPLQQQLVQQGLGLGVGFGGYEAGKHTDPETAKWLRRYISNLGGQYSLHAGLGFGAGQAVRAGQNPTSSTAARAAQQALPLPTTEPVEELLKYLFGGLQKKDIPRGAMPAQLHELITSPPSSGLGSLPRIRPRN